MSVRGSGPHILFYSNKCNWCKAFLEELKQTPLTSQFKYVCCDPSPTRPKLPSYLKEVPTIVIQGDPEPKATSEAFNWLSIEKMKLETEANRNRGGGSGQQGQQDSEFDAWNPLEHTSFSKGMAYSFNDSDTTTGGSGGLKIPGAFQMLGGNAASGERNANDFPGAGQIQQNRQKSKKEELFDKQMEQYERERNMGIPQARPRT
jgi:hypothetical protein